jgi:hypothetical protein
MEAFGLSQVALAGIVFLVILVSFGIVSAVLDHHWRRYEIEAERRRRARRIYYTGAGVILAFMLVAFAFLII